MRTLGFVLDADITGPSIPRMFGIHEKAFGDGEHIFPAETEDENEDDPDNGLVILKVIHEDGEDLLSTPDTEEEAEAVYELFMEELFSDEDEEYDL